jgi:hypothetical protein
MSFAESIFTLGHDAHILVMIGRLDPRAKAEIRPPRFAEGNLAGSSGAGGDGDGDIIVDDFFDHPCG